MNNSNQNLGAVFFNKLVNHLNNNPLIKGEFLSLCKEQKKNPVKVIEYVAEDCVAKFKQDPKQHHYCVEEDISLEHGEYLFDGIYTCKGCEVSQSLARTKGRSFY